MTIPYAHDAPCAWASAFSMDPGICASGRRTVGARRSRGCPPLARMIGSIVQNTKSVESQFEWRSRSTVETSALLASVALAVTSARIEKTRSASYSERALGRVCDP